MKMIIQLEIYRKSLIKSQYETYKAYGIFDGCRFYNMNDSNCSGGFSEEYLPGDLCTYCNVESNNTVIVKSLKSPGTDSNFTTIATTFLSKFLNTTRAGSAHKQSGISVQTFLSGILASTVFFVLQLFVFTIARNKLKNVYQARKITGLMDNAKNNDRVREESTGIQKTWQKIKAVFDWVGPVVSTPVQNYQNTAGIDAYYFSRYMRMLTILFFVLTAIVFPILVPIHYSSSLKVDTQDINISHRWLEKINISQVIQQESQLLIFHLILCFFVIFCFHFLLLSELKHVKSQFMAYKREINEVLIFLDKIPDDMKGNKDKILKSVSFLLPATKLSARFLPRQCNSLQHQYTFLKKVKKKLEKALVAIIFEKHYTALNEQMQGLGTATIKKIYIKSRILLFRLCTIRRYCQFDLNLRCKKVSCFPYLYIPIPSIYCKSFIETQYESFDLMFKQYKISMKKWKDQCKAIKKWDESEYLFAQNDSSSKVYCDKVFISLKLTDTAKEVTENLLYEHLLRLTNAFIVHNKKGIIWSNIKISNPLTLFLRKTLADVLSVSITMGYIIPIAIIALISQIPYVTSVIPFLSEIETDSKIFNNMIASIVPVITIVFLTEYAPYLFRYFSYLRCKRTRAEIEVDSQKWVFMFLFVHIFLVVTISSGLSILVEKMINNPTAIPTLLAKDLPKGSNFFCSFVIIRCIAYAGGNFLQLKELLFEIFYFRLSIYTPSTRLYRMTHIPIPQWGTTYSIFSVLGGIGIIFSIISPVMLPLCTIGFALVYASCKYLCEYQYCGVNVSETFGRLYPQALMQLYAGVYFMEFSMIGLFALSNSYKLCCGMILGLIFTILAHFKVSHSSLVKLNRFSLNQTRIEKYHLSLSPESDASFPIMDAEFNPELLLLRDTKGIAQKEVEFIEKNYKLNCRLNQFLMNEFGKVEFTNL